MKRYIYLLLTNLFFGACETDYVEDDSKRLVIEAFLYENQTVDSVQIRAMVPLISDDDFEDNISDAEVLLRTSEGETYSLFPSEDAGFYTNDDLTITQGVIYELEVNYQNQNLYSETQLPDSPTGLSLSNDILYVTQITDPSQLGERTNEGVIVSWDNPTSRSFFVQVDNILDQGDIVAITFPGGANPPGNRFRLVTQPTEGSSYLLDTRSMPDYGVYRVVLYALNQEYVDLYETSGDDSRSFSEPLTNITNGLGVFTSFSSDTTYLTIVKP